jgi:hypothetical protein
MYGEFARHIPRVSGVSKVNNNKLLVDERLDLSGAAFNWIQSTDTADVVDEVE